MRSEPHFTAFAGNRCIASGSSEQVLLEAKRSQEEGESEPVLIFDDRTGKQVDFDLRGSRDEVLTRLASHPLFAGQEETSAQRTGPGRPKLGVVSREVSLLPRHWEWLEQKPQGISAALRRLVDEARKREPDKERARLARDAAAKFMWTMAGNLSDFEEASRALFSGDRMRFDALIQPWPVDIRAHILKLIGEGPEVGPS